MKEKNYFKVGIFVFAGLLFAMYIIFRIGGEQQLFESQYTLITKFKDISGLRIGAPVQLAGLKIGFVDKISFSPDLSKKEIELALKVNRRYQDRIRKDSTAEINTQGLLGDKFVFISVGSETQSILKNNEWIESKETVTIFNIAEKSSEIVEDVRAAANSARKFFEDVYTTKQDVRQALHSIKEIMQKTEKGEGLLHALIFEPGGKEVVRNIDSSLEMLRNIIGRVDEADQKSGEVSGVLKNLRQASKGLNEIVDRVNRGEGTIGGIINDPAIYNDLRSLFGRANRNKLLKAVVRATLAENDK